MREEADAISRALAHLMAAGVPATDARASALVEKHRAHIDRWFYPCSREIHVALGEMFARGVVRGAVWTRNCDRHGATSDRFAATATASLSSAAAPSRSAASLLRPARREVHHLGAGAVVLTKQPADRVVRDARSLQVPGVQRGDHRLGDRGDDPHPGRGPVDVGREGFDEGQAVAIGCLPPPISA